MPRSAAGLYNLDHLEARFLLSRQVIGYFPDWEYGALINRVDWSALTHVNYFSIVPTAAGALPAQSASGYSFANMDAVVTAAHGKGVKVSIVIGGAGLDSTFMPIAQSSTATTNFVNNLKTFCTAHSLDGVDLDWEPTWGTLTVAQITAYGNLINAIKSGAPNLVLSAAVNCLPQPTDAGSRYVVPTSAVNSLDFINVMAYDIQVPNHSDYNQSVNALANWYNYAAPSGVTKSKMILGMPFYAHENSWSTARTYQFMIDNYATVAADPSLDNAGGWYFNNRTTIQNKCQYVVNNGYGGAMMWQLAQDHFTSGAYDSYSLLPVIKSTIGITNFATRDAAGNLVATGDANPNTFTLNVTASSVEITQGATTRTYPLSLINSITVNGLGGDDTLNYSGTTGKPIIFAGGSGNDTLNVNGGTFTFNADAFPATVNLSLIVNAGAGVTFNSTQHLAALTINSGATANLSANGNRTLVTKALSISGTGRLDLWNNNLILDYTDPVAVDQIRSLLISGRNGGSWNGPGLMTSSSPAVAGSGLGYALATDLFSSFPAVFASEPIDSTSVLVRYTYEGDATLDRLVDVADLGILASNWQQSPRTFALGDFDYNGTVDVNDLGILASNWQATLAASAPVSAASRSSPREKRLIDQLSL